LLSIFRKACGCPDFHYFFLAQSGPGATFKTLKKHLLQFP